MKKFCLVPLIVFCCFTLIMGCAPAEAIPVDEPAADASAPAAPDVIEDIQATPLPENTPTPIHAILLFEENFAEDSLGWQGRDGVISVDQAGLSLEMPVNEKMGDYMGLLSQPQKTIQIDGDCTFEAKFSNKVRFSGLLFNPTMEYYSFIISSGARADFPPGHANLGLLRPSLGDKAFDTLGDIEGLLASFEDDISLKVEFVGSQVQVYVNNQLIASREAEVFQGLKTFGGFYVANGDKYTVTELKIWGNSAESIQIK